MTMRIPDQSVRKSVRAAKEAQAKERAEAERAIGARIDEDGKIRQKRNQ
jgi:hypothetical protein